MPHRSHRLALTVVLGIVFGLLGMHTLSGDAMGHGPGMMSPAHASGVSPHDSASAPALASYETSAAEASGPPLSSDMLMVCVLALLAAVALIAPPSSSLGLSPRLHRMPGGRASLTRAAPSRPPSHIALCISRT
ncbi:DUF6153 family protein [Microbacterium sp.]|uniref:DUF6153 family protein n=1 Tax=Microbacterium sp. TaxID=51671 RepID=UPI0028A5F270|nr:DUF6153 family protein [Microbacterium sp.]